LTIRQEARHRANLLQPGNDLRLGWLPIWLISVVDGHGGRPCCRRQTPRQSVEGWAQSADLLPPVWVVSGHSTGAVH